VTALAALRRRALRLFRSPASYQAKRDNAANWRMIEPRLADCASVLDVGCDAGFYALGAARGGRFALGLDPLHQSIAHARRIAEAERLTAVFGVMEVRPDTAGTFPVFDAVLCLSVFHHFVRAFGEAEARSLVRKLQTRARKRLFLQIPSRLSKYAPGFSGDFRDDAGRVEAYVRELFNDLPASRVARVGDRAEVNRAGEVRTLFTIESSMRQDPTGASPV
jgi:SAM-dependent methyltransferase